MDGDGFTRAGATGTLAVLLLAAGCASQSPAPVSPPPAKPASQPKPAAPAPKAAAARPTPSPVPAKPAQPAPRVEAPTGKAAGSKMSAADARALVDHHNKARTAVGIKPLKWSATLAANAQKWADHLASTSCKMEHSSDGAYGENLYRGTAGHFSALDASKAWEAEKKDYDGPLTRSNVKAVGHYTQMVWRETARIGCGEVTCARNLLVVCNYDPPGNYLGRKAY